MYSIHTVHGVAAIPDLNYILSIYSNYREFNFKIKMYT